MCKIIRKGYNHNHSNCITISAPFLNKRWIYTIYTLYRPRLSHHVFQFFVLFYDFRFIILHNTCNTSWLHFSLFSVRSQETSARFEYVLYPPCEIVVRTALRGSCKSPPLSTQPASHWKPAGSSIALQHEAGM